MTHFDAVDSHPCFVDFGKVSDRKKHMALFHAEGTFENEELGGWKNYALYASQGGVCEHRASTTVSTTSPPGSVATCDGCGLVLARDVYDPTELM